MFGDPIHPPTRAGGNPAAPQLAEVRIVNADGTVDLQLTRSRASRSRVPVVRGLVVGVGDRVVLEHLDHDPQTPIVTAAL